MNSKLGNYLLSLLLWTWGGTIYFFIEIIYKSLSNKSENISWTMLLVAIILCIPLERCGDEFPWEMPMILQTLICAIIITFTELCVGIFLNLYLGLNIWDYSNLPFNFLGQICLSFFGIWIIFSYFGIKIFDKMRFYIQGGEEPSYKFFKINRRSINYEN